MPPTPRPSSKLANNKTAEGTLMDMRALVDYLNETAYQYYTLGEPTIFRRRVGQKSTTSCAAWRRKRASACRTPPTRRVGAQPLANFEQHTHLGAAVEPGQGAESRGRCANGRRARTSWPEQPVEYVVRTQVRWADHQSHLRKRAAGGRGHARQRHRRRRDFAAGADHPLRAALHPLQGAHGGTRRVLHAHLRLSTPTTKRPRSP